MTSLKYDEYGIPVLTETGMLLAELTESDARLEKVLGRKLTPTEKSAADSMGSEHASYGSTRFYLKALLPVDGPNHIDGIGSEAASAAFYVNQSGRLIVLDYSSESHNHPSYVCAHPGAATGTGGDQRDRIAKDGHRVSAVCEARRQCHPRFNPHRDPVKQHTDETTKGIGDYANAMGIPHGDGSIKYHTGFSGNNLVNVCGVTVSERARLLSNKVPQEGRPEDYLAIYVGKASDTTGLGGTKFASQAIDMTNSDLNEKAVQDPDPHLQEAEVRGIEMLVDKAVAEGWKNKFSIKDMGAAGLLCSTSEQLHDDIGVVINGDLIPQNAARTSTELLEAETQERFMIYVHKDYAQAVLDIFNADIGLPYINNGACARIIGRCNSSGRYVFVNDGVVDVDMPHEDLSSGPLLCRKLKEPTREHQAVSRHPPLPRAIRNIFESINFKSDAYVYDHYDSHVQSTNILTRGEACATLRTHRLLEGKAAYSVSFDSNAVIGLLDPKLQAEDSFVRGAYKMAAVGCSVIGVTNNANYGRTDVPEEMWGFVKGQEGVAKACYSWELEDEYLSEIGKDKEIAEKLSADSRRHVTVNSGNCSLNKANANTGTAIPPTAILGLVGWTNKPSMYAGWGMKNRNSMLFLVGARQKQMGATDYLQASFGPDCIGDEAFAIDYKTCQREVNAIIKAVRNGFVSAANAVEEGGLCNAVGEMVANTRNPVDVTIYVDRKMGDSGLNDRQKLFSESMGMVLQVAAGRVRDFQSLCRENDVVPYEIGNVKVCDKMDGRLSFSTVSKYIAGTKYVSYIQREIRDLYDNKIERELSNGVMQ